MAFAFVAHAISVGVYLPSSRIDKVIFGLTARGAILDSKGFILGVSEGWIAFAKQAGLRTIRHGLGFNYLDFCPNSDPSSGAVRNGLKHLLGGGTDLFSSAYECTPPGHDAAWWLLVAAKLKARPTEIAVLHLNFDQFLFSGLGPLVSLIDLGSSARQLEDLVIRAVNRSISETLSTRRPLAGRVSSQDAKLLATLTHGQVEVLRLLSRGASNADVAKARSVSVQAAKAQVNALTRKLNLENRTQTAIFAVRNNIEPT